MNIDLNNRLTGKLDNQDQRLVRELVLGVSSRRIYLERVISHYLHSELSQTKLELRIVLFLGAYQILFMPWIGQHAAVHESVELAKRQASLRYGSKMINAVLRKLAIDKDSWLDQKAMNDLEQAAFFGFPEWIARMWQAHYGQKTALEIMQAMDRQRGVGIRINPRKAKRFDVQIALHEMDFKTRMMTYSPSGIYVEQAKELSETEEYQTGKFSIQDESAMLVGDLIQPQAGDKILDLCAAPGGKSFHLAEKCPACTIISNDLYAGKVKRMQEESQRLGLTNCSFSQHDAEEFFSEWEANFDYCVVDAPCSALGLIGRKPEIKALRQPEDLDKLQKTQRAILTHAARYLKVGGILVYATCTLNKKENEKQMAWFCQQFDFEPIPLSSPLPAERIELANTPGMITLFPHIDRTNGFFIAVLRKEKP